MQQGELCRTCSGSGQNLVLVVCPDCNGTGEVKPERDDFYDDE